MKSTDGQIPAPIFRLGGELVINRLGLGAMRLTGQPGNWGPYADWSSGIRVLREAVELGINFIDTADAYGPGASEDLIAEALAPYPPSLVIATKGGSVKTGPGQVHADGSPEYLRSACEASLRRLKLDTIELYQLHRVDPKVPLADSLGALIDLRAEGKITLIGLSNVSLEQLQEAEKLTPIATVQNRFNLLDRSDEPVVDYCHERGIAYLAYSPLAANPFEREAKLAQATNDATSRLAAKLQATPSQIALAWLLYRAPNIVPIPGTTSLAHLRENYATLKLRLATEDLEALNGA